MRSAKKYYLCVASVVLFFDSAIVSALEIQPGIGAALEHTDNAALTAEDEASDTIAVAYVGANISEDEGPLNYNAQVALNRYNYLQDTFEDSRYFNLGANADWEMIKDRFHWLMSDHFTQRAINSFDANTPDNIQDTNVFSFGANITFPFSARNSFTLIPNYSQYYFELQDTDNKQYSLAGNWNYLMTRLINVGASLSTRNINYVQSGSFVASVEDTRFTTFSLSLSGRQPSSVYDINLGSTTVKREGGAETSGFSGSLNWLTDLTSRSTFNTTVSTELTDSSSIALSNDSGLPNSSAPVTTDVIRNSVFNLTYQRDDASLRTTVRTDYIKVDYSESPLDQLDKILEVTLDYPLSRKLTGGAYVNYRYSKRLNTARVDEVSTVGGNLKYSFSRKLNGLFDLKYRERESTIDSEQFDELTVYVSLVYGFGDVYRPSRVSTGF